jgi:hypothetical protein
MKVTEVAKTVTHYAALSCFYNIDDAQEQVGSAPVLLLLRR